MAWKIEVSASADKDLRKINPVARTRILTFLTDRLAPRDNPRQLGEALVGKKYEGLWKYRVGDYRILAEIRDQTVTILVVGVGNRREVYR
jgi:mRNA interferase RelE/StbE